VLDATDHATRLRLRRGPPELRTMTGDLADRSGLSDDIPNARWQSAAFFAKLFGAWVAMGFKSPKITHVNGEIDA
jgi:hypothetical protein